jgi:UDP-glucuronate decarboxylase
MMRLEREKAPMKAAREPGLRMQPDDGRVVSSFIVQALRGDAITIFGDGGQTRSFCYFTPLILRQREESV